MGSKSVDSDGDPSAEVSAAEAGHAAAGDASKHRLESTDANANSSQADEEHNETHAGVDVRPARSSFQTVFVFGTVYKVEFELGSCFIIAVGTWAVAVINDIV